MRPLTIGTRGSRLALRQVEIVRGLLSSADPGIETRVVEIKTEGDASTAPLSEIGGAGVFSGAIEQALLERRIDVAVHSLKDLPPAATDRLLIAAIPERGDARDALVSRAGARLADLAPGARIGTGSARRAAQLRRLRADVQPADIRGNVDTRVRKVDGGEYDAIVVALAGLERLGLDGRASQVFTVDEMIPAVGQGCLAVQVRADDAEAIEVVRAIDHGPSRVAATCERAFLERLGAGCRLPVGAHARLGTGDVLEILAMLETEDGRLLFSRNEGRPEEASELGRLIAEALLTSSEQVRS